MAKSALSVRRQKGRPLQIIVKPDKSAKLTTMFRDYRTATDQYGVIVRYLRAAIEVLPKPECQLLLEFAETAKTHCEQLPRLIKRQLHNLEEATSVGLSR